MNYKLILNNGPEIYKMFGLDLQRSRELDNLILEPFRTMRFNNPEFISAQYQSDLFNKLAYAAIPELLTEISAHCDNLNELAHVTFMLGLQAKRYLIVARPHLRTEFEFQV